MTCIKKDIQKSWFGNLIDWVDSKVSKISPMQNVELYEKYPDLAIWTNKYEVIKNSGDIIDGMSIYDYVKKNGLNEATLQKLKVVFFDKVGGELEGMLKKIYDSGTLVRSGVQAKDFKMLGQKYYRKLVDGSMSEEDFLKDMKNGNLFSFLLHENKDIIGGLGSDKKVLEGLFGKPATEKEFRHWQQWLEAYSGTTVVGSEMETLSGFGKFINGFINFNSPKIMAIGQTLSGLTGVGLLTANFVSTAVDWFVKQSDRVDHSAMSGLRSKYGIGIIPGVSTYTPLDFTGFKEALRNPAQTMKSLLFGTIKDLGLGTINLGKETFQVGIGNFAEILNMNRFLNDSFDTIIRQNYGGIDGFESILAKTREAGTDKEFLARVNELVKKELMNTKGVSLDFRDNNFLASPRKRMFLNTYFTYGHWGWNQTRNFVRNTSNLLRGNFVDKKTIRIMQDVGEEKAREYILKANLYNDELLGFVQKIFTMAYMGHQVSRMSQDKSGDNAWERTKDSFTLGAMFHAGIQGFESTPVGREILSLINGISSDYDMDGLDSHDVGAGVIQVLNMFFKDISKRFVLPKAFMTTMGEGYTGIVELISNLLESVQGYGRMIADNQTAYGFNVNLPKTSKSLLTDIFPFMSKMSEQYYGETVGKKLALLTNDFKTYGSHRIEYSLPFLKEYNIGKLSAEQNTGEQLMQDLAGDVWVDNFLKRDIDRTVEPDLAEDAFKILSELGLWAAKPAKDSLSKFKLDDIAKTFPRAPTQGKEDMFVNQMKEALDAKDYDTFLKYFNSTDNENAKYGVQLLSFFDAQSPGSSRELISAIVSQERHKRGQTVKLDLYGDTGGTLSPAIQKQIDMSIGRDYFDFLYEIDKPSYTKLVAGYAIKKFGDKYKGMIEKTDSDHINFKSDTLELLFKNSMITEILINEGVKDPTSWNNAFATIRGERQVDRESPVYKELMVRANNEMLHKIKDSELPESTKHMIMGSVLHSLHTKIPDVNQLKEIEPEVRKERLDFFYHNNSEIMRLGKELGYNILNREGGLTKISDGVSTTEGETKITGEVPTKTGTILDDYFTNGTTSSNYRDSAAESLYKKGKGYYDKNAEYIKNNFLEMLRYNYGSKISYKIYQDRTNYTYTPSERRYLKSLANYNPYFAPGYTKQIGDYDPKQDFGAKPNSRTFTQERGKIKINDSGKARTKPKPRMTPRLKTDTGSRKRLTK